MHFVNLKSEKLALGALLDQSKKASNVKQSNQYANQAGWHGRHLVRKARMSDNRGTLMSLLSSPPDISDLLVGARDARASSNCSKEIFYLCSSTH